MQAEDIIKLGGIVIERIEDGFECYKHEVISGTSEELLHLIIQHRDRNGIENSFVDFYYGRLKEEEQERIRQVVPFTWQEKLKEYEANREIYYSLSQELLELTWFLTSNEYLFSTFYFCKEPCTIWGNYNQTVVCFYG